MAGSIWVPGNPSNIAFGALLASQGGAVSETLSLNVGYITGVMAYIQSKITFSGAGTAANAILLTYILSPTYTFISSLIGSGIPIGEFVYITAGGTRYAGNILLSAVGSMQLITNAGTALFGVNPAVTIASGDTLSIKIFTPLGA